MRKKSRLFALAEALRARRTGVTAQQLADRFGVTLRTIYRDLEALQDAGMPIRAMTSCSNLSTSIASGVVEVWNSMSSSAGYANMKNRAR